MLIKHRLYVNCGIVLVSILLMFFLIQYSSANISKLSSALFESEQLNSSMLMLRRHEKDFLARKDMKYLDRFDKEISKVNVFITDVSHIFSDFGIDTAPLKRLQTTFSEYHEIFQELVKEQQTVGLNPKDGAYGDLRSAVHGVEKILEANQSYQLMAAMLQLRRNEKDFMLRDDEKYLTQFKDNVRVFYQDVDSSDLPPQTKQQLRESLGIYEREFSELVAAVKNIGLDENSGLRGKLRSTIHSTEEALEIVSNMSKQEISDNLSSTRWMAGVVSVLITIVTVAMSLMIARSIIVPIDKVSGAIGRIINEDDFTISVDVKGEHELALLAQDFNRLVGAFRNVVVDINKSVDLLNDAAEETAQNSQKTSEGMDSQHKETDSVTAAVTEMSTTIDEIARNTENTAGFAASTNESASAGLAEVNESIERIHSLAKQLQDSGDVVGELEKDSDVIGSVLDVIRGIAEQTNLLALNAAIEAARAGEQGRGFAVVADEVRNLAMRTQESTEEITNIVQSLQQRTGSIVSLMSESRAQGISSAEQASTAGQRLSQITTDINNIMDMTNQIATAIEEQSMVAADVGKSVVRIRDLGEEANEACHQNKIASGMVAEQAAKLRDAIRRYKV